MAYADALRSKTWTASDIAALIEGIFVAGFPLTWTGWTPTYGVPGGLTYGSVTTTAAKYIQIGKLVFFYIRCSGTLGGLAAGGLSFTAPVAQSTANDTACGSVMTVDNGTYKTGILALQTSNRIFAYKHDLAAWATSGTATLSGCGFYAAT